MNEKEKNQEQVEARRLWDQAASTFDNEPDHGLRDPLVLQAWTDLLRAALPMSGGRVLDIGCGTGSLSVVLAGLGYEVTGIDFSLEMIALAKAKAARAGRQVEFKVMNGAFPQLTGQPFDAILCRHLLWALPEPAQVLVRWANLLKPGGRLILIEGFWHTGAGLHAAELLKALPDTLPLVTVQNLSDQAALWGGAVSDERYQLIARRA